MVCIFFDMLFVAYCSGVLFVFCFLNCLRLLMLFGLLTTCCFSLERPNTLFLNFYPEA